MADRTRLGEERTSDLTNFAGLADNSPKNTEKSDIGNSIWLVGSYPMPRDIPKLFALAEERVARTDAFLHTQHAFIDTLRRLGQDTTQAEAALHEWEGLRVGFIADRDRLREELEQAT